MKLRTAMLAFLVCALVACAGGRLMPTPDTPNMPSDSAPAGDSSPALAALSQLSPRISDQIKPLVSNPFSCTASVSRIPGTYAELLVFDGRLHGSVFKSVPGSLTEWFLGRFVKATPAPSPSPGSTPTPKPTPTPVATAPPGQPLYLFAGSYVLHKYGQGCVFVLASVNGKKIKGSYKNNAFAVGVPVFKGDTMIVPSSLKMGPLSITVNNLGADGGKGNVILLNPAGHGKAVDSGTVTLTSRVEIKP